MATEGVWVSDSIMDSTLMKGFRSNNFYADEPQELDALRRNKAGESLPAERVPTELYGMYAGEVEKKPPPISFCGGWMTVSEKCADILRQFDLGKSALYETHLFQHDQKTSIEGRYFCLNLAEHKNTFQAEHSPGSRRLNPKVQFWKLAGMPKDDDLALRVTALEGADLWWEDKVRRAFFMSDRLVKALRKARIDRRFGLTKCRIMRDN